MPRPRGRSLPSRAPKRKVSWENLAFNLQLTVALNIAVADLTSEPIQTITGDVGTVTLRRTILNFKPVCLTTAAVGVAQIVSVAILVMTVDAFEQNGFADPEGTAFQDYLYWTRRTGYAIGSGEVARFEDWNADIRSMRKLRGGYKLVLLASHPSANTESIDLRVSARFLWSQP